MNQSKNYLHNYRRANKMRNVIYTAIYPYNKFIDRMLPEVLELFINTDTKNRNIDIYQLLRDLEST